MCGYIQSEAIIRRFVVVRADRQEIWSLGRKVQTTESVSHKAEYSNWISFECIIKASFNLLLTTLDPHSSLESVCVFFSEPFFCSPASSARWCCEGLSIVWCICVRCLSLNGPPDWNDNYEKNVCVLWDYEECAHWLEQYCWDDKLITFDFVLLIMRYFHLNAMEFNLTIFCALCLSSRHIYRSLLNWITMYTQALE